MPNNAKTTRHTPYAPLNAAIGPSSSTELIKGVHSNTPDARPAPLQSGPEGQAHRLKLAMRKKNGNLPSLSYQQRNRLSGSVQNLPKCKDQVDDLVQLESKLSHLIMGVRTNLKPIAQETRLYEFRD